MTKIQLKLGKNPSTGLRLEIPGNLQKVNQSDEKGTVLLPNAYLFENGKLR